MAVARWYALQLLQDTEIFNALPMFGSALFLECLLLPQDDVHVEKAAGACMSMHREAQRHTYSFLLSLNSANKKEEGTENLPIKTVVCFVYVGGLSPLLL